MSFKKAEEYSNYIDAYQKEGVEDFSKLLERFAKGMSNFIQDKLGKNSKGVLFNKNEGFSKSLALAAVVCFLVLQLLFLSSYTALADGPSFDCTKAATPVEKLICDSPELSRLDSVLFRYYESLRTVLNGRGKKKLQLRQNRWLKNRDKECKKIAGKEKKEQYLQSLYKNRTAELGALTNDLMDYRPTITKKYPNKWGMQLPLPQYADGKARLSSLYITPQNDLVVLYFFDTGEKAKIARFISFFTGKILKEFNYQRSKKSDNRIENYEANKNFFRLPYLSSLEKLGFRVKGDNSYKGMLLRDGGRLKNRSKRGGNCHLAIDSYLIRYDKHGKEIFQKAIVRVTEKPRRIKSRTECYTMEGSDDATALVHSTTIRPRIHELPDGTYIVIESEGPTIIRFTKDFTSPYIDNSDELLFTDAKKLFKKYDEIQSALFDKGFNEKCNVFMECHNIRMTEYFKELIAQKRR